MYAIRSYYEPGEEIRLHETDTPAQAVAVDISARHRERRRRNVDRVDDRPGKDVRRHDREAPSYNFV